MYCQYCGKQIDDDSIFCVHCGKHQLDEGVGGSGQFIASAEDNAGKRKSGISLGVKIGIVVAVIAVIGAIIAAVVIFALPNPDDSSENATTQEASDASDDASEKDTVAALKDAKEGDLVTLGQYEQDSGSSAEGIEWVVLGVEDGHALLLSDKAIDCKQVASSISPNFDVTWEKSDIRKWLNGDFLKSFTEAEIDAIDTAKIGQSRDGETQDKVFLMDSSEFSAYVPKDLASALATDYAAEQGILTFSDTRACNWWLRDYNPSTGTLADDNNFLYVDQSGEVNKSGFRVTENGVGVRPAMWVSLDGHGVSGITMSKTAKSASQNSMGTGTTSAGMVSLVVEAADGSTLAGDVRVDQNGFVIADSSSREYSLEELRALNLSDAELCVAWNEPFARQGYHFKNSGLQAYFEACAWYVDTGNTSNLSGIAATNNTRLRELADGSASAKRWEILAAN